MKTQKIPRSFGHVADLGRSNLIVGGCSFTYNVSDNHASSWPYYLRDRLNFTKVYDCSMLGAGNYHIMTAVQWCIENTQLDPSNTAVIVMWSGNDRDGEIVDAAATTWGYHYTEQVGFATNNDCVVTKSRSSRAVENYLYLVGLSTYLKSKQIPAIFLQYLNPNMPSRTNDFDIRSYLPRTLAEQYSRLFAPVETIYEYCIRRDLLGDDDFHPTPDGHLQWTDQRLVPYIQSTPNPYTV